MAALASPARDRHFDTPVPHGGARAYDSAVEEVKRLDRNMVKLYIPLPPSACQPFLWAYLPPVLFVHVSTVFCSLFTPWALKKTPEQPVFRNFCSFGSLLIIFFSN